MSAMCVTALSVKEQNSFFWSQNVIAKIEKTVQARIDRTAAEIFERAGRPTGKELQSRMAAERQLSLSRVRLIECSDSITLFAFVPDAPEKRLSVFLTSRGVAVRSIPKEKGPDANDEQFLIARWGTEVDPHTAFGTLDGNTFCLTAWQLPSPKVRNRFQLWSLSSASSNRNDLQLTNRRMRT
jgi:hypothetical protein